MTTPMTREEVLALPATVDLVTGARAFGIGRTVAYERARAGEFPCEVIRVGSSYRVITADLQRKLQVAPQTGDGAGVPAPTPSNESVPVTTSSHQ